MKIHLRAYETDIYSNTHCGKQVFRGDKMKVIDSGDLTEENERNVCKKCLHLYDPDMYPKEFTDTF